MTTFVGGIGPQDEGMHQPTDEAQFSENMLFTFFDRTSGAPGGLMRIGNRVNEGHAEVTVLMYLPDGGTLFQFKRASIEGNRGFDAAGVKFEVMEPGERIRTTYDGPAIIMADPQMLSDPKKAFTQSPTVDAEIDLIQHGRSPVFSPMPNHYEQHMRVEGELRYDGTVVEFDAAGVRDHTWGQRNWQATLSDRTIWCSFDEDFGITLSLTWHDPSDPPELLARFCTRDTVQDVVKADIESTYADDGVTHTGFTLNMTLEDGTELPPIVGRVTSVVPLRHRRNDMVTYIGQGMTEFTCGDRKAWGLSEYMDLLKDGKRSLSVG